MVREEPATLPLTRLFAIFLRFGCLAFGGPVAQIAMVRHELVDRRGWIDSARFNRLLAVMQVLPGPEAHELCVHMGMVARGRLGGLLAGLGFMLPGLLLMLACGWAYTRFVLDHAGIAQALLGVQVAVLAVILRSIHKIGSHIVTGAGLAGLALVAFLATLAGVPFWLVLAGAGLAHMADLRWWQASALLALLALAGWWLLPASNGASLAGGAASMATPLALFVAGLKGGLLTFGGAYTAIPYVRADTVGRGWLSDAQFLDGVALANMLPAPLVIFATFAGYVAGGPLGALAITAGMFLPAFAFSLLFFERLEAVLAQPRLHRLLDGVAAAAVGVIAATLVQLAMALAGRVETLAVAAALFALALLAAWRLKGAWVAPAIIAAGAAAGLLLAGRGL
jgi:chromate transporter